MKPAVFRYYDPASLDDALSLLADWGTDARVLAGGQTLGPMLNLRVVSPGAIIDINQVRALDYRRVTSDGLAIGALTRQAALEDDPSFASNQPLVAAAIPFIAHRAIRNRGTVGGTLAHADPAAEWGGIALALDATMALRRRSSGERTVPAREFFHSIIETAIEPDEMLVEVRLPHWPTGAGFSFQEFSRRHGDFAIAGIACVISPGADGASRDVRLAAFGVGATAVRLSAAEELLKGERPAQALIEEGARRAAQEVEPLTDRQGSAEYRRHLVRILVERALREAVSMQGQTIH
jgi:aerobic carbon-monoxide dehydrogenase medium subunit